MTVQFCFWLLWNIQGRVWWSLQVSTFLQLSIPRGLSKTFSFRLSCNYSDDYIFYVVVLWHWWPHVYKLLKFIGRAGHESCYVSTGDFCLFYKMHFFFFFLQKKLEEIYEYKKKLLALNVAVHRFVVEHKEYIGSSLKNDISDLYSIWDNLCTR